MEKKTDDFISKVPDIFVKVIQEQQNIGQYQNYMQKLENDIIYFKEHGTFPKPSDTDIGNGQNIKQKVLKENARNNIQQIKLERISEVPQNGSQTDLTTNNFQKENMNPVKLEMPPPQLPLKKNKKIKKEPSINNTRSTRSKASSKTHTQKEPGNNLGRESDLILEKQAIEIVSLIDSDNEDGESLNQQSKPRKNNSEVAKNVVEETSTRQTRTKTRTKKKNNVENGKRTRSPSSNTEKPTNTEATKQMKRKKSEEPPEEESQYEDAKANLEKTKSINGNIPQEKLNETDGTTTPQKNYAPSNLDKTVVIKKNVNDATIPVLEKETQGATDKTVIIDKPKMLGNGYLTPDLNDIMTDDEDDNVTVTVPKKATLTAKAGSKAIFNPFEGSPVKKRVEAFEKLGVEDTSGIPIRNTRTRTKAKVDGKEQEVSALTPKKLPKQNRDTKMTPQAANRYLATISSSANKAMRTNTINESFLSVKSLSALKASQQEFNEREQKRREKEAEAIKKRAAQFHAQTEEKKQKRVEKQMKAQQAREAYERSKLEALKDAEKAKAERHKQIVAEKQEKIKKHQEEAERRRQEAFHKALEEKRKEEERKRATEEAQEKLKQDQLRKLLQEERRAARAMEHKKKIRGRIPIYLREKAPLLPTEDCHDSDAEESDKRRTRTKPAWTTTKQTFSKLEIINCVEKKCISSFFLMVVTTPDLQDIFETIDPTKLKRTSSAIWKVPPRFTMMPESIEEKDEEDC